MKGKLITVCITTVFVLLNVAIVVGQSAPALPGKPSQAPIGGLGILAAAGVGYAMYKLREKRQE